MRCFTVLEPSQSGKTTLAGLEDTRCLIEAADPLALTAFAFTGEPWCAIDIAGGSEQAALACGALMASDAAVLCLPAETRGGDDVGFENSSLNFEEIKIDHDGFLFG